MMRIQKYLIVFVVILSFVSCKGTDEESCSIIDFDEAQVMTEQELFSKVEIISLQNKDDLILSNVSQIIVEEPYILIKDSKNVIYVYTDKGNLVSSSSRKIGNGLGEYSIVTAFGFNSNTNHVEILTPQNLLYYDTHFNFVKKIPLPTEWSKSGKGMLFFGQIYNLSSEQHILVPTSISKDSNQMFIFDSSKAKIKEELDCSEGFVAGINMQEQCFFDFSDHLLGIVPPFVSEYLYTFDKAKNVFSKAYKINFGKNGLQASDVDNLGKNEERLHNLLMSTEKEFPITTLETEKYISFLMKKGSNMKKRIMLFYDKSSGKIGRINCFSNKEIVFPIAKNADKTSLYAVVEKNRLQRIISHLKNNNVNISYKETDNSDYYILKYLYK